MARIHEPFDSSNHLIPEGSDSVDLGSIWSRFRSLFAKSITVDTVNYVTLNPPAPVPPTLPLSVANGGTAQTSTAAGYVKGGNPFTIQSTPLPAADLGSGPSATTVLHGNQTFAGVALGAGGDVTGTLPVGSGGTGQTATTAGYVKGGNPMTIQATPIPAADLGSGSPGATTFLRGDQTYTVPVHSLITNSLSGDVSINNASNYFDGPSVAQGSTGTWFVSGTVVVIDSTSITNADVKLWDGTTVIASARHRLDVVPGSYCISLSGYLASPAGNLRMSVKTGTTTGTIQFNVTGNSKDSTISAIRVA